ncbi:hypothetical protein JX266_001327 [Neoarthrinium moseri]|nr:hypothetical protein JX266_001327 [Neoarthrinium moseri]
MVQINAFAVGLTALLLGQATAFPNECKNGMRYCGYNLLNGGPFQQVWEQRLNAALPPNQQGHQFGSTFICNSDQVSVRFEDYCPDKGAGWVCKNGNNNLCVVDPLFPGQDCCSNVN